MILKKTQVHNVFVLRAISSSASRAVVVMLDKHEARHAAGLLNYRCRNTDTVWEVQTVPIVTLGDVQAEVKSVA